MTELDLDPYLDDMYSELFKLHKDNVIRYCINRGLTKEESEDVTSEAFIRALAIENKELFMSLKPEQQGGWLYATANNIIKEQRIVSAKSHKLIDNYIKRRFKSGDLFDEYLIEQDYSDYAKAIRSILGDADRELFDDIFDKKPNYEYLSKKYNVKEGTMRTRVNRLRDKIKLILKIIF